MTRSYGAVLLANGHHWDPRLPEPAYPGEFHGEQIHPHEYRSGDQLAGKDVVVVGAGNSAMDIAVEGAKRARSVQLSVRRGEWVLKKWLLGIPVDWIRFPGWVPWWATRLRLRIGALTSGGHARFGLPHPRHAPGQSHPVQSDRIREVLKKGQVAAKPGIARVEGEHVVCTDGSRARADLIVWATGYRVTFPFLIPRC